MDGMEEKIRERAYAIWEEEGRPEGREQEHWERAAREFGHLGDQHRHSGNGLTSSLQSGGTIPGSGPGASMGSIGTGGGTGGEHTGSKT